MQRLTTLLVVLSLLAPLRIATPRGTALSLTAPPEQSTNLEPLVIVVNRSNPVNGLTFPELRKIFLGQRSHWTPDRRITLVMREPGEPERKAMLQDVYGLSEDQLKTHFLHGLFTGEILVSPKILATPSGVRKFIFNVPGAIGYLRLSDVDASVKVIRIDELLPGDRGYKLYLQSRPSE
jgi:ABC-type phosphate transport system substrate-binding protein